ncbi:cell division protein FtsZ [bacterium]|nr:cell division protein FtsZ [bacterium]
MANDKNSDTLRFGFSEEQRARLKVIGVGGAGSNAVDNMITSGLAGVEFIAVNTDMQALDSSKAPRKVQIGRDLTRGLGAGGDPMIGRASAEEDKENLRGLIEGAEMVFIAAGMGGGTGSGAAPIIAELAREKGILTVGIVTKPFLFEGKKRLNRAIEAIAEMKDAVDTLIIIPNNKLLSVIDKNASYLQAFRKADDVLFQGTKGISDIINTRGLVNVDFADAKAVMSNAGDAIMGIGTGEGDDRAKIAAEEAITSPLLDNLSIEGARGLLINITGNEELGMMEVQEAVELITERAGEDADVYFGIVNDAEMGDKISVTVIATGFPVEQEKSSSMRVPEPNVSFRTAGGQGRPQTKVQSVRETADTANGNGNGTNGHSNGQNGHANGSNGQANGKNGHSDHKEFLRVEADPEVVMDSLADMSSIDMNDRDLPAFLRRRQQGR